MGLDEAGRFWWHHEPVPEGHYAPDNSVTGTLKIDDEGRSSLELHGALGRSPETVEIGPSTSQIAPTISIQGRLNGSGKHVILNRLSRVGMKFGSYGVFEQYRADFCLVGNNAVPAAMKEMTISSVETELDGFEEWLRLGSIEFSRTDEGFSAEYKKESDFVYDLNDGTITVKYELYAPHGKHKIREMEAREVVSFVYTARPPLSIEGAILRYQLMQDFLILLTNSNHSLGLPTVSLEGIDGSFALHFQRNKGDEKGPARFGSWIDFPELKPVFGTVFSAWKAKRESFGPAFYLYLGTRRGLPQYIENRFLNLVVGIEAYHREKFPVSDEPTNLNKKIERILGAVAQPKDRSWLRGKLKTAAEPSLEERLYALFVKLPFDLDKKALREFAKASAKLRNDISHFGGWRKHGDYNDFMNEIHGRSEIISHFYQTLILREIGLTDDVLARWLHDNARAYPIKMHMERFGIWNFPKKS